MAKYLKATNESPDTTAEGAVNFSLIENIYHQKHLPNVYLPSNGEIAREEHIREPFELIHQLDTYLNNALGNVYGESIGLYHRLKASVDTVNSKLNSIQSKLNKWQLTSQIELTNRLEINERFSTPLTLEVDTVDEKENIIGTIESKTANITLNDSENPEDIADAVNRGEVLTISSKAVFSNPQDWNNLDGHLKQFEAENNLTRLPQDNAITIDMPKVSSLEEIQLNGIVEFKLNNPELLSYIALDIDAEAVEYISVHDPRGSLLFKVKKVNTLYFQPTYVSYIRLQLRDNVPVKKQSMTLTAYVVVVNSFDSQISYVYYR